jgi:hypothetical protein
MFVKNLSPIFYFHFLTSQSGANTLKTKSWLLDQYAYDLNVVGCDDDENKVRYVTGLDFPVVQVKNVYLPPPV